MRILKHLLAGTVAVLLPALAAASSTANLAELIRSGERAAAMAAIQAGADVNQPLPDGSTPLLWAVYKVDLALVQALLSRGANPNIRSKLGAVPLLEAADLADPQLVGALLKSKADPNLGNEDDQTPLMIAARNGSVESVQLLLKAGARVNTREKFRGQTALMWAVGAGNAQVVDLLIRHKADVNARSDINDWGNQVTSEPRAQYRPAGGMTVLLVGARGGCLDCVKSLLKAGADINKPTPEGITPLMTAIDNLNFDMANYLLDHGANPHIADWYGRTALYNAVDMRTYSNRFIVGAGNQPAEGEAPPRVAEALALTKRLLEMGADPNIQLNFHRPGRGGNSGRFTDDLLTTGATPLLRAALAFDVESAQLLLQHGALIDLPNVMGMTPLMAAAGLGLSPRDTRGSYGSDAQERSLKMLDLLVKAGADINARVTDTSSHSAIIARPSAMTNRQGQTAIFGAINWGWTRVAKFLLDHGARLDITDAAGKTIHDALKGNAGGRDFRASEEMNKLIGAALGKGS